MINLIYKYKHKVFIENVITIIDGKEYILKDYFFNDHWCMVLFINNKMFLAIKDMNNQTKEENNKNYLRFIEFSSKKELLDFNLWKNNKDYDILKELIKKAHNKKFKSTFLIAETEHLIEDMSNFLRERSIHSKLDLFTSSEILSKILKDEFAHLYVENKINNDKPCIGKGFD